MLDVAQNTARLNVLMNAYYTAEYELETKTESKLHLTQNSSQSTIDNQKQTMALRDKFNAMEDVKDAKWSEYEIEGTDCKVDVREDSGITRESFLEDYWDIKHPKPDLGQDKYAPVTSDTHGFTLPEIKSLYGTKLNSDAKAAVGAEPNKSQYTKTETTTDADGNEVTNTVPDEDAYNNAMKEYKQKIQDKVDDLATKMQDQLIKARNADINEQFKADEAQWQTDRSQAGALFSGARALSKGDTKSFSRMKQQAEDEQQLKFDQDQHDLSVQESMLDQQIQKLQAEVTALKTEIDSLKSERNSNVQSDFKLFG